MPRVRQRLAVLSLISALACLPASAATIEEMELSSKLVEDSTLLLDQLLGPGRSKVIITVEGERTETKTSSEIETPLGEKPGPGRPAQPGEKPPGDNEMPGYSPTYLPAKEMEKTTEYIKDHYVQHDQQQSMRSNFQVNKINVSLLLDQSVAPAQAETIRKVLSDMLRLNVLRGDSIVVVRASLSPLWKRLVMSPEVFRSLLGEVIIAGALLGAGLMICLILMWSMRTLSEAIGRRLPPAPVGGGGQEPLPAAPGEPELLGPDGLPALGAMGGAGELQGIGFDQGRFAFLGGHPPQEIAQILEAESAEELAILFSWLADHQTELGTMLFSFLPPPLQLETSKAMVKLKQADPERIDVLEGRLRTLVESRLRGTDKLGRILSRLAPSERESILGDLSRIDAQAMQEVQDSLVTFEDLAALKVEDLRKLAVILPIEVWATALRGSDRAFADQLASLFPEGMRAGFQEALDTAQPKEKVLEARSKILSQALALVDQGQLVLKPAKQAQII